MSRLTWADPGSRLFETGLDRGVLYPNAAVYRSSSEISPALGSRIFAISPPTSRPPAVGAQVTAVCGAVQVTGMVTSSSSTSVTINITEVLGFSGGSELIRPTSVAAIDGSSPFGDVWRDDNDATKVNFFNSTVQPNGFIPAAVSTTISDLILHFRAAGHGPVGSTITCSLWQVFDEPLIFFGGSHAGFYWPNFGVPADFDIPNDGVFRNYSVTVDSAMLAYKGLSSLEDVLTILQSAGCSIGFANTNPGTSDGLASSVDISEAWLEIVPVSGDPLNNWVITSPRAGVPWNGLTSFDENASSGIETYHQDGRPYLNLPLPKEFSGTLKAYTYPDLFAEMIGYAEATQGMYVDSQMGDSFGLSYRTKVGNDLDGIDHGYKIHLVYQATVAAPSQSFETLSNSISPQEFSFEISTVPLPLEGFAPMAHVILDSRTFDPDELAQVEDVLYGTSGTPPQLPKPQELYDLLTVGDHIEIVDNGDGTWSAIGSAENVYITTPGEFEIDNVNAVIPGADGPGSYDVSSTP